MQLHVICAGHCTGAFSGMSLGLQYSLKSKETKTKFLPQKKNAHEHVDFLIDQYETDTASQSVSAGTEQELLPS